MEHFYRKSLVCFGTVISFLAFTLTCMDKPTPKMINLQLDDSSIYPIQKWKVKKESNTLCELYYCQHTDTQHTYGKNRPIPLIVANISREEITLFDHALDKNIDPQETNSFADYFDTLTSTQKRVLTIATGQYDANARKKLCALRLTAQLADKWFEHALVNTNLVKKCSQEFQSLCMYLKSCMILVNIGSQKITPSEISSYNYQDCYIKTVGGAPICMPKTKNLQCANFNAQPIPITIKEEDGSENDLVLLSKNHQLIRHNPHQLIVLKNKFPIGTVSHPSKITRACLSPDDKWLISVSHAMSGRENSQLHLTSLDISSDEYLNDATLISHDNWNTAPCFNNTSTIVAFGDIKNITLYSLQVKKPLQPLSLHTTETVIRWPLELIFTPDDTRLIGCLQSFENGRLANKHTCMIWDTSELDNIKELQCIEFDTPYSHDATITFNYPTQDTVAISTLYETFFFDIKSGTFLSKTIIPESEKKDTYAASCSIQCSPISLIAKNSNNKPNYITLYNHQSGECLGKFPLGFRPIVGLGMTMNARSLVVTFDEYKTKTIELLSDEENAPLLALSKSMGLTDFYGLLELYRAKKEKRKIEISLPFFKYLKNRATQGIYKDLVEKYLLSIP